jgi:hypothetical protein
MPELVTTETQPTAERVAPARPRPRATDRIPADVSIALGVAWWVGYLAGTALEPSTSHPMPVLGVVLGAALLAGILVTAVGLAARRRWGLQASLASSGLLVASTVACPTTGHHHFGLWWAGQMAISLVLVAASVFALRRVDSNV